MTDAPQQAAPGRVVVLIPALNEERSIAQVLDSVLALGLPIIMIDDGSEDRTAEIAAERPVTLIRHAQRGGKGNALRAGFREALAQGYDGVLTMDADGQHVAADIPRILAAAARHPGHIVVGARIVNRHRQPRYRRVANGFADWGVGWACGQRLIDTQSGQRYYPRAAVECGDLASEGFVFESDILIEAAWRRGVRVAAVPIESRYHAEFRRSHFRSLPDFLRITRHVVMKIVRAGCLWDNYRASRASPALLVETPEAADAPAPVLDPSRGRT
ncbi:glycosyltransferase family 2 protein [Coralloluteibacterium thermophilus]|uniref:Glycosyltransferase family 2 protein n=1 Tax=Coralloluteibacterium thermophilum TaxID=2707049 RepID=A0ABV9NLT2_9GAMM